MLDVLKRFFQERGRTLPYGRVKVVGLPAAGVAVTLLYILDAPPRMLFDMLFVSFSLLLFVILLCRGLRAGIVVEKEICTLVYRGLLVTRRYRADDIAEFGMLDMRWARWDGAVIMVRKWGGRPHVWWSLGDGFEEDDSQFLESLSRELEGCCSGMGWEIYESRL